MAFPVALLAMLFSNGDASADPGKSICARKVGAHLLTSVSIFEGDPKSQADLAPDDDRFNGHSSLWTFVAPKDGKPLDLRVVCRYGASGVTRTTKLAPTVKSCVVGRSPKRDDRVLSVSCR